MNIVNVLNPLRVYRIHDKGMMKNKLYPKLNGRLDLGKFSIANAETEVLCWRWPETIKVGKYSSLGKCSFVVDGNHNPYFASTYPFAELGYANDAPQNQLIKSIPIVGNDVWIGENAFVYSGVVIGDGAVVAGNAVVTKNVPPYAIVAGNPARVVKYRFPSDIIERFIKVKWWDLPDDFVFDELAPHIAYPKTFLELAEKYE